VQHLDLTGDDIRDLAAILKRLLRETKYPGELLKSRAHERSG
jgi:hypothetical protein